MNKNVFGVAAFAATAFAGTAHASCGSAFCLVNTDWSAQGYYLEPGVLFDLKYETVTLDQPRTGTRRIGVGEIPAHHDEVETKNRNFIAAVDWSVAPEWGVSFVLPYVDRDHVHIHNHRGEKLLETWSFRDLGDMRVVGRYEVHSSRETVERQSSFGVTLGVKLPTGKYDVTNAEGDLAERSLQPGTGTTDVLLGLYWSSAAPLANTSWFARVQGVLPANEREGFKPGKAVYADAGARYAVANDVGLMLQLNYVWKDRDSGSEAEPEDSGQQQLWLSPGVSWNVAKNVQIYAFAQFPLYQKVNGVQLTADWSALTGVSWRF